MVTVSRLKERRQNLLGVIYVVVGENLYMRFSSCDANTVRFVAVVPGTQLINSTMTWEDFAMCLQTGAIEESML